MESFIWKCRVEVEEKNPGRLEKGESGGLRLLPARGLLSTPGFMLDMYEGNRGAMNDGPGPGRSDRRIRL
jgi:hypothetical protein